MASRALARIRSQELSKILPTRASGLSIMLPILMIACGFLGIAHSIEISFGVAVIAWLLIISSVLQLVHLYRCKGVGDTTWKALIAILYLGTGIYFRLNLDLGLAALTLALTGFFLNQGLIDTLSYVRDRRSYASVWLLISGVISLVLALMIWRHWPASSRRVADTLVGINMIMVGITRLMLTVANRRLPGEPYKAADGSFLVH